LKPELRQKSDRVAAILAACEGHSLDAHYLAFFKLFDQRCFFEAHEVLEEMWLPARDGLEGPFYKALIQLAGGFVHLQKGRTGAAAALFKLSMTNLEQYATIHQRLDVGSLRHLIAEWLRRSEAIRVAAGDFSPADAPKLADLLEGVT
jgi:predicted metal-dependent hydrolase